MFLKHVIKITWLLLCINNYFRLSKKLVVIRWFEDYLEQRCKLFIHKNSAERWKGKGDEENEQHWNGKQKTSSDRQWRPVFLHYSMPRNTHMLACLILCLRWHLASSYILMMRYFYTYFKRITRMSCPMPIAICIPFCTWILALGKQTVTVKKLSCYNLHFEKCKKIDHYLRKTLLFDNSIFSFK